jgi:hypothetical protein
MLHTIVWPVKVIAALFGTKGCAFTVAEPVAADVQPAPFNTLMV